LIAGRPKLDYVNMMKLARLPDRERLRALLGAVLLSAPRRRRRRRRL